MLKGWISAIKKKKFAELVVKQRIADKVVKKGYHMMADLRRKKKQEIFKLVLCTKVVVKFRVFVRKVYGPFGVDSIHLSFLRDSLCVFAQFQESKNLIYLLERQDQINQYEAIMKEQDEGFKQMLLKKYHTEKPHSWVNTFTGSPPTKIVMTFLNHVWRIREHERMHYLFTTKIRRMFYIQSKIREKYLMFKARVDVFIQYWNSFFKKLEFILKIKNDPVLKEFLGQIQMVPEKLKQ